MNNTDSMDTKVIDDKPTCSICLDIMAQNESTGILTACLHMFHFQCITEWMNTSMNCPLCRFPIEKDAGIDIGDMISAANYLKMSPEERRLCVEKARRLLPSSLTGCMTKLQYFDFLNNEIFDRQLQRPVTILINKRIKYDHVKCEHNSMTMTNELKYCVKSERSNAMGEKKKLLDLMWTIFVDNWTYQFDISPFWRKYKTYVPDQILLRQK